MQRVFRKQRPIAEINVVPYIDVMLVLLIIFMITAPLLTQGVKIDLPKTSSDPLPQNDKEPVLINVDKDGNVYINYGENPDKPISSNVLITRVVALRKYQPNIPVLIGGDKRVDYGYVINIVSALQQAGVNSVSMITKPPEKINSQ